MIQDSLKPVYCLNVFFAAGNSATIGGPAGAGTYNPSFSINRPLRRSGIQKIIGSTISIDHCLAIFLKKDKNGYAKTALILNLHFKNKIFFANTGRHNGSTGTSSLLAGKINTNIVVFNFHSGMSNAPEEHPLCRKNVVVEEPAPAGPPVSPKSGYLKSIGI